jgi:hypothetical protein
LTPARESLTQLPCMHQDVSARHPNWTVNLKRVRKLLCKVVTPPEDEQADDVKSATRSTWTEEEVEDWCVITKPGIAEPAAVSKAASTKVSELWAARRRGRSLT